MNAQDQQQFFLRGFMCVKETYNCYTINRSIYPINTFMDVWLVMSNYDYILHVQAEIEMCHVVTYF